MGATCAVPAAPRRRRRGDAARPQASQNIFLLIAAAGADRAFATNPRATCANFQTSAWACNSRFVLAVHELAGQGLTRFCTFGFVGPTRKHPRYHSRADLRRRRESGLQLAPRVDAGRRQVGKIVDRVGDADLAIVVGVARVVAVRAAPLKRYEFVDRVLMPILPSSLQSPRKYEGSSTTPPRSQWRDGARPTG